MRPRVSNSQAYSWGAAALFLASAALLLALAFEHIGGMKPCPLCLQQRWAYYLAIPVTFLALVLLTSGQPKLGAGLFGLVALAFGANSVLGIYHAGVEWGFWAGPDTCSGTVSFAAEAGNILDRMKNSPPVVRCDQASGRFAGLSFAGWNVVASLMLFTASVKAVISCRDHETYL